MMKSLEAQTPYRIPSTVKVRFPKAFSKFQNKECMQKETKLPIINPHACGIDVGSRLHYVAVGQGSEQVRSFGVYTKDHREMIGYLRSEGVETIAMESTGNYWQTLYMSLSDAGFQVFLVCGNQTRNVKGRKTDVQDCQWIQWLHSVGMLTHSFIPSGQVARVRLHARQRLKYIQVQNRLVNQMQRDLRLMNIRLEVALNDITGKSGRAIIEAILSGVREPETLAALADWRVKKGRDEIASALQGNWDGDLLIVLDQHYREYKHNLGLIEECERTIDRIMGEHLEGSEIAPAQAPTHKKALKKNKTTPCVDLQGHSYRYFGGIDLFAIEGVNQNTVLALVSEVGTDIGRFRSAKSFSSWLHLCPNQKITGGKVISSHAKKGANPLSQALKSAANAIGNIKAGSHLAMFFKRIAYRKGRKEAIVATANKLAVIIYNMLTKYQPYKPYEKNNDEEKYRLRKLKEIDRVVKKYQIRPEEVSFG